LGLGRIVRRKRKIKKKKDPFAVKRGRKPALRRQLCKEKKTSISCKRESTRGTIRGASQPLHKETYLSAKLGERKKSSTTTT